MTSLIDTNVLVYRFDPREPAKQQLARDLLRAGLADDSLVLPHQAVPEFVAAVTRPRPELDDAPLLSRADAFREAESMLTQFRTIYPGPDVLKTALRGAAAYGLSWFDAHLWRPAASPRSSRRVSSTAVTMEACAWWIRSCRPPAAYRSCRLCTATEATLLENSRFPSRF